MKNKWPVLSKLLFKVVILQHETTNKINYDNFGINASSIGKGN